ncbi:MAG: antibiotic biosynthesis monooxygenase [Anaerolineae bacterium]|nr:antibiotic biosynthesis monooxygenase [Anaerolineae bacterium]
MFIVHVFCHVKPEFVDAFKALCIENACNSVQEPGIARFDVIQQTDDPTHFVLVEVYRTPEDPTQHKATAHYAAWAEAVTAQDMLVEPRSKLIYDNVFPDEEGWD